MLKKTCLENLLEEKTPGAPQQMQINFTDILRYPQGCTGGSSLNGAAWCPIRMAAGIPETNFRS